METQQRRNLSDLADHLRFWKVCLNVLVSNSILTLVTLLHFHFLLSSSNSIIFDSVGTNYHKQFNSGKMMTLSLTVITNVAFYS